MRELWHVWIAHPYLPMFLRCSVAIISIGEKKLTIQNKTSVSYILRGCESGSVPTFCPGEIFSLSESEGGISSFSKINFFERSWKSELRFSAISSNAARCALTNVRVVGVREPTVDAPFSEGDFAGGVKERRMAVPPLFP